MSKIVIIRDNFGSGKTTVSKALQKKMKKGTLLIQQDYIRMEMLGVEDTPDNPSVKLLENLVIFGHQNCDLVILEGTFNKWNYQKLFIKIEEIYKNQIFAYYFYLPFEETLMRHNQKPHPPLIW